ncbi:MAG: hypothetical protein ACI9LO_001565 [Planctomycetota bacterium]|jgi:hypothetical protein
MDGPAGAPVARVLGPVIWASLVQSNFEAVYTYEPNPLEARSTQTHTRWDP